jgi:DNA-binding transcriptional LysR family regulator
MMDFTKEERALFLRLFNLATGTPQLTPEGEKLFREAYQHSYAFERWLRDGDPPQETFGGSHLRRSIVTGIKAEYPDFDWHVAFRQGKTCE